MSRKTISTNNQKKKTNRQSNRISWRYCVLTLICGLLLITGFFFAARQHFSSIDYSIKNSRLRRQLDELEADKRRFVLAKEIALSPAEIKKVARKIGFTETTDKLAALPANISSTVKSGAEKVKRVISDKTDTVKKAVATPAKEVTKSSKLQETIDKQDKLQNRNAAK